jgi:hypothetical protein
LSASESELSTIKKTFQSPDSLVETGGDHHVLGGVELGTHHIVVVSRQHRETDPGLPVPDPHRLEYKDKKIEGSPPDLLIYFLTQVLIAFSALFSFLPFSSVYSYFLSCGSGVHPPFRDGLKVTN